MASWSGLGHETTRFPGAMALGAADDVALTEAVGRATGDELRALGITVCYAPVCDLAITPGNVSLGTRAFGSDPAHVGRHAAALTRGLQAGGVAATAKHFPGFGAVDVDPHHRLGVVEAPVEVLEARELAPFRAAFGAGAAMVMSGHVALPAITGDRALPATVSRQVMHGLLRRQLGFQGVSITDAMDMKALAQGSAGIVDSLVALRAGVDLLLLTPDRAAQRRLEAGLRQAALRGLRGSGWHPRLADPDPPAAPLAGGLRASGPGRGAERVASRTGAPGRRRWPHARARRGRAPAAAPGARRAHRRHHAAATRPHACRFLG